jgi:hypothetical protein
MVWSMSANSAGRIAGLVDAPASIAATLRRQLDPKVFRELIELLGSE